MSLILNMSEYSPISAMIKDKNSSHLYQSIRIRPLICDICFGCHISEYQYKKHRGASMRVAILPIGIILSKAHRATVSMMAKRCIVA